MKQDLAPIRAFAVASRCHEAPTVECGHVCVLCNEHGPVVGMWLVDTGDRFEGAVVAMPIPAPLLSSEDILN